MENNFNKVQFLLRSKAELQARLNLIPYEGSVEIKYIDDKKYLYVRKRIVITQKNCYTETVIENNYGLLYKGEVSIYGQNCIGKRPSCLSEKG